MADDDGPEKTIDLTSTRFDAFTALYSRNVRLPSPKAPVLDNLTKFQETDKGVVMKKFNKSVVKKGVGEASTSKERFKPHQGPVPGRAKRAAINVLTRMTNVKGPLALLQKCMDQRIRVKVLTRNMIGIRGYCSGYLVAFDKNFNMALQDVTEVWTRKRHYKTPALGPEEDVEVPTVKVVVRSSTAKTQECERFVPQLLMRGEHVAVVIAQGH